MEQSHLELVGKGVGAGPEMGRKGGRFKTRVRMETVSRGAWGRQWERAEGKEGSCTEKSRKAGFAGWRCGVGPRSQGGMRRAVARKAVAMARRPGKVAALRAKVMGTIFKGRAEAGQDQKAR